MNYLFVINLLSGKKNTRIKNANKVLEVKKEIEQNPGFKNKVFEFIYIQDENFDSQTIVEAIKSFSISHLILCGGDGTYQKIIQYLFETNPKILKNIIFGFLPMGSGNGLASHLKMSLNKKHFVELIRKNHIQKIDGILVNSKYISIHNIGCGLDAELIAQFNKNRKRGVVTYLKLLWNLFLNVQSYYLTIEAEGVKVEKELILFSVLNSNQFGMKIKTAPFAKISDGKLDVLILMLKGNKFYLLLSFILHLLQPKFIFLNNKTSRILYFQTSNIILEHKNVPFQFSGENFEMKESKIHIKVIPDFINCLVLNKKNN